MTYDLSPELCHGPLIAITLFAVIATATAYMRWQARRIKQLYHGWDDYLMFVALITLYVSIGIEYACVINGGTGRHMTDINPNDAVITLKLIIPFEAIYGITLPSIKCSMILFYLRIFGTVPSFKISAYISMAIIVAWGMSVVLETFLLCRPLAYNWDTTIDGVCGQRNTVYVSAGALNVITDFIVMALPVPHILSLQLNMKKKMGLLLMFSLGLFITIISIIRIRSLQAIDFSDPTYTLPMGLFWTTLEPCLGIINCNLPLVRSYLSFSLPSVFGSTKEATSHGSRMRSGSRPLDDYELEHSRKEKSRTLIRAGPVGGSDGASVESQERLTKHTARGNFIMMSNRIDVEHEVEHEV